MRAIGAGSSDEIDIAVEHKRSAAVLRDRRQQFDAAGHFRFTAGREPQQHGRDVGRFQRGLQLARES